MNIIKQELLNTICEFRDSIQIDTIWITDTETMLDRLISLYYLAGGTEHELLVRIPHLWMAS